jgi:hypothetical protein
MAVNVRRSPALAKLIEEDRLEAERLREKWGDPEEALGRIVRQIFDAEFLDTAFRELTHGGSIWDDDEPDGR